MAAKKTPISLPILTLVFAGAFALLAPRMGMPNQWWSPAVISTVPPTEILKVAGVAALIALVIASILRGGSGTPSGIHRVQAAMHMMQGFEDDYITTCKAGTRQGYYPMIEDLPSKVSPENEDSFLRNHQTPKLAIEEFKRAIQIEEEAAASSTIETEKTQRKYNIANARLKLGKVHRAIHDWSAAELELQTSIKELSDLSVHAANAARELGTAYLTLGEVYSLRYRQTGNPTDKAAAVRAFEASIASDQKAGEESSQTSRLLQDLR